MNTNAKFKGWYFLMLSLILLITVSCSKESNHTVVDYTGEELFKGVFFLEEEVASSLKTLVPQLIEKNNAEKASPEAREYYVNFVNEIVTQINELDPDYFETFKAQVQSDNYYSIELALSNGSKMIKAAGFKSEELSGVFKLMNEFQNKKVDFESSEMKGLDFEKEEDVKKLKNILREDYAINLDDEQYSVACLPVVAICIVYAAAAVVSIAAVAYTAVAAVQGAVWVAYYAWIEAWGASTYQNNIAASDALVKDIALTF